MLESMKAKVIIWVMAAMLPVIASAQDDMYFVPKKKAKQEKTKNTSKTVKEDVYGQTQEPAEYYSGTLRDVDEYNRRGNTGRNVTIMTETDTFDIDESRLVLDEKGNYVLTPENDRKQNRSYYDEDYDDYLYSTRLSRFHGVGYPYYGWYDPWYYDPWYYDPWYYNSYWSWYGGWYGYYGWHSPWYYHNYWG